MTAYPVGVASALLFLAQTDSHTLSNDGPATVYVSFKPNASISDGLPISVGGTVIWDADRPCYGVADVGGAKLRVNSNSGPVTNPSAIASAIISQGLAGQIAAAIAGQALNVTAATVGISGAQVGASSAGGFTVPDTSKYLLVNASGSYIGAAPGYTPFNNTFTITPNTGKSVTFRTLNLALGNYLAAANPYLTFTILDTLTNTYLFYYNVNLPTYNYTVDLLGLAASLNAPVIVTITINVYSQPNSATALQGSSAASFLYKVT